MKKAELVFIPAPGFGHLVATAEIAKHLVCRDDRLSVTVLFMKFPFDSTSQKESLTASAAISDRIQFIHLSTDEATNSNNVAPSTTTHNIFAYIESYKTHVKDVLSKRGQSFPGAEPPRLAGIFLDMFCTTMMDVATELGVPSYIYYTSNAAFLGFIFHVQALHEENKLDPAEFKDSDAEFVIPSLVNPLPAKVLPSIMFHEDLLVPFLENARRFKETKGILVNTFLEYESHAIRSLDDGKIPPVYPVGPILNLESDGQGVGSSKRNAYKEIMQWLDDQPPSSVVFLCFGSMGSFDADQVKRIACALEHSRHRFLWSLRKPPPKGKIELPTDYADPQEVLPEGFLDRTAGIGKVIGWAPQGSILAHPAVGGFVSHCGWNSILESIWYSVPIAAWPMYAEHQFLAFQLVVELGLAVEIKMDYRKELTTDGEIVVSAEEIERGIEEVMERDTELRKKVKQMSDKSRMALMEGGSSFCSMGCLIQDVLANMP